MRPEQRITLMVSLIERVWRENPDWRLGQVVGNAARKHDPPLPQGMGAYRDPFNVEDDEVWAGLQRLAEGL